jgi:hypothetical protein
VLPTNDRADYVRIVEALRLYVHGNDEYWNHRQVQTSLRFDDWASKLGECWETNCEPSRCHPGHRQ